VLKKAGIVVATAAVGLLAVSPLAFAGEGYKGHDHHAAKDVDVASSSVQKDSQGLLNALNSNNVTVSPQICNNDIVKGADNINALAGAVALLGFADDSDTTNSSRSCAQDTVGGDVSAAHEG
jgi:hypothetical protein